MFTRRQVSSFMRCLFRATQGGFGLLCLASTTAFSADWIEPFEDQYDPGQPITAGNFLEKHFSSVVRNCDLPKLTRSSWGTEKPLSAIPDSLHGLPLRQFVSVDDINSMPRLFAYVFSGNKPAQGANDLNRFMSADFIANPETMLPDGISTVIDHHSCSSIINAAANGSAQLAIPASSLKAALSSQFSRSNRVSLAVVQGWFRSPLSHALSSLDPADNLYSNLLIWDWYKRNLGGTLEPHVLESTHGIALFYARHIRRSTTISTTVQAGVSTVVGSVDAHVATALRGDDDALITNYASAVFLDNNKTPKSKLTPLQSLSTTKLNVSKHSASAESAYERTLSSDIVNVHAQLLQGVPPTMCAPNFWTIVHKASSETTGNLRLRGVAPMRIGGRATRTCRFEVAYEPSKSIFEKTSSGNVVNLEYTFRGVNAVDGETLEVNAEPLRFATSRSPVLYVTAADAAFRRSDRGESGTELTWEVRLGVDDSTENVDWNRPIQSPGPYLQCGEKQYYVNMQIRATEKALTLTLSRTAPASERLDLSAASNALDCRLTGILSFNMPQGKTTASRIVERPIPTNYTLKHPRALPVAP